MARRGGGTLGGKSCKIEGQRKRGKERDRDRERKRSRGIERSRGVKRSRGKDRSRGLETSRGLERSRGKERDRERQTKSRDERPETESTRYREADRGNTSNKPHHSSLKAPIDSKTAKPKLELIQTRKKTKVQIWKNTK